MQNKSEKYNLKCKSVSENSAEQKNDHLSDNDLKNVNGGLYWTKDMCGMPVCCETEDQLREYEKRRDEALKKKWNLFN